jgi:serine/threonine protein kinase
LSTVGRPNFDVTLPAATVFFFQGEVSEVTGHGMLTGQQFGRYEIRSKIGEGGMGEVYTAVDSELGRSVAIKILPSEFTTDPDRRGRFRQEARVISALNHPNIITIYEVGENEHGSFLATELVDGRTLREVLKSESMTLPRILRIVEQAANALVAAHAAGIVHRDVKPENIMLRRDSIVKVLDFGLAKPSEEIKLSSGSDNKTVPGTVMGSARYMSPEQARGLEVDERTDIWSVGVVLYEMLAGRTPFDGETSADTMAAVIYKEPEPLSQVLPNLPSELHRILRKALQKDREERYQSVKDLALDIRELVFEIEHRNSGDRVRPSISSPEFLENPTMIHRTVSANHPTGETAATTTRFGLAGEQPVNRRILKPWLFGVLSLLVLAAAAFGVYTLVGNQKSPLASAAFEKTQASRVNTPDGKAVAPAISPDGRYIAYVSGEVGNRSLVVRQIATDSQVTVVPATNLNLQNVSFDPEGDHVYYTQTRSDFSINTLYQVPTLGGTPKKLIEDVDSGVTFAPGGKQFAFMRHVSDDNSDVVFIADTATLATEQLTSTKGTDFDFFSNRMAWSPDGKRILLGAGKRQSSFVVGTWFAEVSIADKAVRKLEAEKEFLGVNNFAWLDDGSGFLFVGRETQNQPAQIWRASYPGLGLKQITNDFNDYLDLSISAGGDQIVTVKSDTTASLWRTAPGGRDGDQITAEGRGMEGALGVAQMPDGQLVYARSEGKSSSLWTADPDGKNAKSLVADAGAFAVSPAVTPDGKTVVFNLQKDKTSRIWRVDADGKNAAILTTEESADADFNPSITPDGKTVVFQRQFAGQDRSVLMKVPVEGGKPEILLSSEQWGVFQPRVSPDGKRLAFVGYDVKTFDKKIHIAAFDNAAIGKMENEIDYNLVSGFRWAPDGRSLTVLTNRGGILNIWRQPLDGAAPTQMTNYNSGRIFNFAWANDGRLLLARGNTNNDLILIRDTGRTLAEVSKRRTYRSVA